LADSFQGIKTNSVYFKELDALRALAIMMTLLAHFYPVKIPYMWYGVSIFFTISGFLITYLLIQQAEIPNKIRTIKNFIIRRALRLFPAYYLFLGIYIVLYYVFSIYLWNPEYTFYLLTYTANIYIIQHGNGTLECFNHLWSLAVEEQFYLFWPLIILFTPKRFYLFVLLSIIFLPYLLYFLNVWKLNEGFLFPFHTLGTGALLGYLYFKYDSATLWLDKYKNRLLLFQTIHLLLVLFFIETKLITSDFILLYREFALAGFTFAMVNTTLWGWSKPVNILTKSPLIQYIGKISYGIYLYHMPIPFLLVIILSKIGFNVNAINAYLLFMVNIFITIFIAHISYNYFETPFVKLKNRFK